MTEQKKPEPGQWLVMNDDPSEKAFLVGKTAEGKWVIEWRDGDMSVDGFGIEDWHHEPDCTGWDWQPPNWVEITNPDHVVRQCDRLSDYGTQWYGPSDLTGALGKKFGECGFKRLRCLRKDLPPVQEVWPKYYVHKYSSMDWYIKRASPTECVCFSNVTDAKKRLWTASFDGFVAEGTWKEVTESEALSRITNPIEPEVNRGKIVNLQEHQKALTADQIAEIEKAGRTSAPIYNDSKEWICENGPQPSPLQIYATADDILYLDIQPRQTTHREVDLGVPVVIRLKEVSNG